QPLGMGLSRFPSGYVANGHPSSSTHCSPHFSPLTGQRAFTDRWSRAVENETEILGRVAANGGASPRELCPFGLVRRNFQLLRLDQVRDHCFSCRFLNWITDYENIVRISAIKRADAVAVGTCGCIKVNHVE